MNHLLFAALLVVLTAGCGRQASPSAAPRVARQAPAQAPNYGQTQHVPPPTYSPAPPPQTSGWDTRPPKVVVDCLVCDATGRQLCTYCGGSGENNTGNPFADPPIPPGRCGACSGTGKIRCQTCRGTGKYAG